MRITLPHDEPLSLILALAGALTAASLIAASPAAGQARLAAGLATPAGEATDRRTSGPVLRLAYDQAGDTWLARVSLEGLLLRGREREEGGREPDLASAGASLEGILRVGEEIRPYVGVGIGGYWIQLLGERPNVYGPVLVALHLTAGAELGWRVLPVFFEYRSSLVLSDYAVSDFVPLRMRTFTVGLPLP